MKRFKISFLAIIAIAAMSFTVASNGDDVKKKFALDETDCFLPTTSGWTATATCVNPVPVVTTTDCEDAEKYIGRKIFSRPSTLTVGNDYFEFADQTLECPGGDIFCCFNVAPTSQLVCSAPNPSQPQINIGSGNKFYIITTIRCKD